jgi:hypothetical protein
MAKVVFKKRIQNEKMPLLMEKTVKIVTTATEPCRLHDKVDSRLKAWADLHLLPGCGIV